MLIRISHLTSYRYEPPAGSVIQVLRLTPRNHDGQYVTQWRIDLSTDCRLDQHEDAFGNVSHVFTADGPLRELSVLVEGEVETRDTQGIVRGAVERFPPSLYLRETALTAADEAITAFAMNARATAGHDVLGVLHEILDRLHEEMAYEAGPADAPLPAAQAYTRKRGVGRDFAHVFIAAARSLGIPARYVGGYFARGGNTTAPEEAGHAWAEAFVPALGWVAFDAASGICAIDAHVRVATGLDHFGAAPLRGTRYGGGSELVTVRLQVEQAMQQIQD
jgi:transglutaminase-like putative cysteine protease